MSCHDDPIPASEPTIRSLVWATDVDVIGVGGELTRRDRYWVVRCPSNPTFWWGNLLLFDTPPGPGDGDRWESLFRAEFASDPAVTHRTLAWDNTDGLVGAAEPEFVARGYELERTAGLIATPDALMAHPRESRAVSVKALSAGRGEDEALWAQVIDIQTAQKLEGLASDEHRLFLQHRQADLRELFKAGGGSWFAAIEDGSVVGSLGILVTGDRARYQHVDTLASHRGRGIASRLVVEAARMIRERHQVTQFVIAADPDYHAIEIYKSVGFRPVETVTGALKKPQLFGSSS